MYLVVVNICFGIYGECLKLQILLYSLHEGSKYKRKHEICMLLFLFGKYLSLRILNAEEGYLPSMFRNRGLFEQMSVWRNLSCNREAAFLPST